MYVMLDSTIVIDFLRGQADARARVVRMFAEGLQPIVNETSAESGEGTEEIQLQGVIRVRYSSSALQRGARLFPRGHRLRGARAGQAEDRSRPREVHRR